VIGAVLQFPDVSLAQINQLLDDMERRYREFGSTMRAVWQYRRIAAISTGRRDLAEQACQLYLQTERDSLSNCIACEPSNYAGYLSQIERWSEAVDVVDLSLKRKLTCTHEPHRILGTGLLPLFHLGRIDEARRHQKRGYRLARNGLEFVGTWAKHLVFLTLVSELEPARRLLERHMKDGLTCFELDDQFEFLKASLLFLERLRREGRSTVKMRLPESIQIPSTTKGRDLTALADWFRRAATDLANRFDARNGNSHYNEQIERIPVLLEKSLPIVAATK
jgi:tetratricopeptide (TPR) repeat protein